MAGNKNLHEANKAKKDEFYTQLSDIQAELAHYKKHFKGKVVFCNCDDPYESNFFKYFCMNFNYLGLKKLIVTCYSGSPVAGNEISLFEETKPKCGYKLVITKIEDVNKDGAIDLGDVEYMLKKKILKPALLHGDGDFRSEECVKLLKEADIVVTNPPFSLFREYVAQLVEYGKKFLIIGHQNAITYKEIFPLLKDNKMWLGYGFKRNCAHFINTQYKDIATDLDHREGMTRVSGVMWYTNLDIDKRHEKMPLYKNYNADEYPKYDNYDAINVDKTADIPMDYDGVMGVPITFLDKYSPNQFEIIGSMASTTVDKYSKGYPYVNGKKLYARILIRKK